jgi:DNA-binding XRE family transcriptional regulator
MIKTDSECREAESRIKAEADRIEEISRRLVEQRLDHESIKRVIDPLVSFHVQLQEEIDAYKKIKNGDFGIIQNLRDLGRILIGLRIYANLSQRKLAGLLDVDESQVSRDERNEYRNITLERASKIVEILRAQVKMQVTTSPDPEGVQTELAGV